MSKVWVKDGVFTTEQVAIIKNVVTEFELEEAKQEAIIARINAPDKTSLIIACGLLLLTFIGICL